MNRTNRNILIVIAIIAVGLCCCVLVVAAAAGIFLINAPVIGETGISRVTERTAQVLTVGPAPTLEIDNFAGDIIVRRGENDQIRVTATKRAGSSGRLERIDVDVSQEGDRVRIETQRPAGLTGNVAVELELSVPAETRLDLATGAGTVEVTNVRGEIAARTGAGDVQVRGAGAPVALDTNAGDVSYEGQPEGESTLSTGVGDIRLQLPVSVNVEVKLTTGLGNINLGGFDVEGDISGTRVEGTIGTGAQVTVDAHTGLGDVTLIQR